MGSGVWDARLITPERSFALAGEWPFYAHRELAELSQFEMESGGPSRAADRWQVNLRCARCDQSVAYLGDGERQFRQVTVAELMSGVLRHMVMAHDVPLSGAGSSRP
jgi:hypothetical protein